MRKDTEFCLKKYEIHKTAEKWLEPLDAQLPKDELIIYITTSNVTYNIRLPHPAKICGSRSIAITNKAIYTRPMIINSEKIPKIPISSISNCGYKASGLAGAKFTLDMTDGSQLQFLAGYKKDLAAELQKSIESVMSGTFPAGFDAEALMSPGSLRNVGTVSVDDHSRIWYYQASINIIGTPNGPLQSLSFDNVVSCEIEENGTVETVIEKSGLGRAVVGGILFGGAGAIVGAATGSSRIVEKGYVDSLNLRIGLIDAQQPEIILPLIKSRTDTKSISYTKMRKAADDMAVEFQKMIGPLEDAIPEAIPAIASSPADELRKYKELLNDEIITQEEFDKKKKQLLGI
jgi:hypothetical protein